MSRSDEVERLAKMIDEAILRSERLGFPTAALILAIARLEVEQSEPRSQAPLAPKEPWGNLS
jgi:hypothetical protein